MNKFYRSGHLTSWEEDLFGVQAGGPAGQGLLPGSQGRGRRREGNAEQQQSADEREKERQLMMASLKESLVPSCQLRTLPRARRLSQSVPFA